MDRSANQDWASPSTVAPDVHPGLRWPCIILGLLTIFAGVIRFFHIAHPTLWYDEAMVFRRTCGSYGQLLDCLRTDGFVPLHYSLVWVIGRFFKLTPLALRFFPALCGTLMVPAVYFLARQMLPVRTALLAAAFTACSAFMLFYSRDAKMYMDAWLFVTLNSASLLWWFRDRRAVAWLCWIASGCAACGLHATSAVPIAISTLLLFTRHRLTWQQTLLWLAGIMLIFAGPIGYYEKFNLWKDNVEEIGWQKSQLAWINDYNAGRNGPQLVRFFGTTLLMGWEWPKDEDIAKMPASRVVWPARGADLLLVILAAGCLPWPMRWRAESMPAREPQWRVALWLSLWILIPVYGFYCWSMPGFASPKDWWSGSIERYPLLMDRRFWILIIAMLAGLAGLTIRYKQLRPRILRGAALLIVFALLLGLGQLIAVIVTAVSKSNEQAGKPWESLWVPRYMGFIWPMLAVAVAALVMRLPTRWVRGFAIIFLLGLNLAVASFRIFGQTEPPVDRMAIDEFYAEAPSHHTLFWTQLLPSKVSPGGENIYGQPGQYYLQMLQNQPTNPVLFIAEMNARRRTAPGLRSSPWDREIPADLNRIILWSEYDSSGKAVGGEPSIPPNWKMQTEEWFTARDCWIWQDLTRYRRNVYVKAAD